MQDCKVKILGTKYKIKFKKLGNADIDGQCDYTEKKIIVRSDNFNNVGGFKWLQKKQLRHEIIHAFMAESGLESNWEHVQQFGHDETTIDWYAIQSPKIHKVFEKLGIL